MHSDSLSVHEKRRRYLECIEEYVVWLHDHIQVMGGHLPRIERRTYYTGLSARSICVHLFMSSIYYFLTGAAQTILVHEQRVVCALHLERVAAEEKVSLKIFRYGRFC